MTGPDWQYTWPYSGEMRQKQTDLRPWNTKKY